MWTATVVGQVGKKQRNNKETKKQSVIQHLFYFIGEIIKIPCSVFVQLAAYTLLSKLKHVVQGLLSLNLLPSSLLFSILLLALLVAFSVEARALVAIPHVWLFSLVQVFWLVVLSENIDSLFIVFSEADQQWTTNGDNGSHGPCLWNSVLQDLLTTLISVKGSSGQVSGLLLRSGESVGVDEGLSQSAEHFFDVVFVWVMYGWMMITKLIFCQEQRCLVLRLLLSGDGGEEEKELNTSCVSDTTISTTRSAKTAHKNR